MGVKIQVRAGRRLGPALPISLRQARSHWIEGCANIHLLETLSLATMGEGHCSRRGRRPRSEGNSARWPVRRAAIDWKRWVRYFESSRVEVMRVRRRSHEHSGLRAVIYEHHCEEHVYSTSSPVYCPEEQQCRKEGLGGASKIESARWGAAVVNGSGAEDQGGAHQLSI